MSVFGHVGGAAGGAPAGRGAAPGPGPPRGAGPARTTDTMNMGVSIGRDLHINY